MWRVTRDLDAATLSADDRIGTVANAHDVRDPIDTRGEEDQDTADIDGNDGDDNDEELVQQDQDDRDRVDALDDEALEVALATALQAVRTRYAYCVYCGERYADAAAFAAQCPGMFRHDHNG
jgi:hypothetical protein